jgi:hypothetical protein
LRFSRVQFCNMQYSRALLSSVSPRRILLLREAPRVAPTAPGVSAPCAPSLPGALLFIITPYAFEPTSTLPGFSFCDIGQVPSRPYGRVAQLPGRVPRRSRPSARSAPRPDARAGALLFRPRSCARHLIQSNVPQRLPDTGLCRGGGGSSPELHGATRTNEGVGTITRKLKFSWQPTVWQRTKRPLTS